MYVYCFLSKNFGNKIIVFFTAVYVFLLVLFPISGQNKAGTCSGDFLGWAQRGRLAPSAPLEGESMGSELGEYYGWMWINGLMMVHEKNAAATTTTTAAAAAASTEHPSDTMMDVRD